MNVRREGKMKKKKFLICFRNIQKLFFIVILCACASKIAKCKKQKHFKL